MIKKVYVKPGCISCGTCESVCPKIFKVKGTSQVVNHDYAAVADDVLRAEAMCPVNVIVAEQEGAAAAVELAKAQLTKIRELTHDVIEFHFAAKNFDPQPGQYVSLQLKDRRGQFTRSYSIAGVTKTGFRLCIKIEPKGRGGAVLRKLKEGVEIPYLGPAGHFVLKDTQAEKIFVATGTGLAPMMAMLDATPAKVKKKVIFGVRTEEDLFYLDKLKTYKNTEVIATVSRPGEDWSGHRGRVTDYLADIPQEAEVYICGNPAMVQSVRDQMKEQQHPDDLVSYEEFVSAPVPPATPLHKRLFPATFVSAMQWVFIAAAWAVAVAATQTGVTEWMWDVAWWAVVFVMLVRPLTDLVQLPALRQLIVWRKGLGILSAAIVVAAFSLRAVPDASGFFMSYLEIQNWMGTALLARLSEITALLLLLTSNSFSQKRMGRWWKRVQRTSHVYFYSAGFLIYSFGKDEALWSMVVVALVTVAAFAKKRLAHK